MKESYTEGPASHGDPESCASARNDAGEALTGVHMGGVLSRENRCKQGADGVLLSGRQRACARKGESTSNPARSETSSTYGNSMRENREILCFPSNGGSEGRPGNVLDRTPAMHEPGKSDNPIVPTKLPNKAGQPAAEMVEERGLIKENAGQQNMRRTQGRKNMSRALNRMRQGLNGFGVLIRGRSRMR